VAGALIVARPASSGTRAVPAAGREAHSGLAGDFILTLPDAGDYLVSVQREGYYELKDRPIHVEGPQETTLVVNSVREVFQAINGRRAGFPALLRQRRPPLCFSPAVVRTHHGKVTWLAAGSDRS
jgi:hypothetical protein